MRFILPLCLLAALGVAREAPDAATRVQLVEPVFRDVRVVPLPNFQRSAFMISMTADLPNPGWELAVDRVGEPDDQGRIRVELTAEGKEGLWPQVITPRTVRVRLSRLRKGDILVDVFLRRGRAEAYGRAQAIALRGE